jgi:hypothetical protein
MPLGAARLNTLSRVLTVAADPNPRTSQSMVIEAFGDTKISTAQNQFGGSSIAMDGSGDYLQIADVGNNLDFGTDDFTIEWWQYLTSLDRFAIDMRNGSNGAKILLYSYPSDGSADDLYLWVSSANRITASNCLSANQWQHIALVRESGTTSLYVDGTQEGSTYSDTNNYAHDQIRIWHNSIGAENYTPPGYVDEFRISKGNARYSGASITVPTSALTKDEHTHLLIHGDGDNNSTVILDDGVRTAGSVSIDTFGGNTELSTTQAKFGATSAYYDGEGSVDPEHSVLNIGSDDFTIEFFYYPTDFTSQYGRYFIDTGSGLSGRLNGYFEPAGSTFKLRSGNSQIMQGNHDMSTNQWYHIAFVRKSGTLKYYLNGTEKISVSNSTNFTNTDYKIGSYLTGGPYSIKGYLDEFRQSNVARYSQAFTPTTSAFTADGYTKLLLHFDGSNGDTTTTDDGPRALSEWSNGGFTVTSSGQFNDALQLNAGGSHAYLNMLPAGFEFDDDQTLTLEFRFKISDGGTSNKTTKLFSTSSLGSDGFPTSSNQLTLHTYSDGNLYFTHDGSETNLGSADTNFHHIAMQYNGAGSFHLWLDGTHKISASHSISATTNLFFGNRQAGEGTNSGTNTIDEIRLSSNNRYTHSSSNITVPTAEFTNDDDTIALFHMESTTQTDDNS